VSSSVEAASGAVPARIGERWLQPLVDLQLAVGEQNPRSHFQTLPAGLSFQAVEQVPQKLLLRQIPRCGQLTEPVQKAHCYRQRRQNVDPVLKWRSLELQVPFAFAAWE
jgi:hypothetical protein